jgi:phosphatidate cytidylyltransferase
MILSALLPISGSLFFGYYVYKGYFWMVITNGSVMINDIMAFVFGKTMGKTPLIKLSPNKTVEGFVGGGISTCIFAIWVSIYVSLIFIDRRIHFSIPVDNMPTKGHNISSI